ncbi:hypothetical protein C4D60_Mb03t00950 [Musa balbisiana]|uniref:Uncharacterized protein n=1 Tax=Musa balbisiana TaxID=52838 RepID=A0A4V6T4B3_MUSBA|nr:hypothetical protein C4D60_Mb03t00950 [Musa balbisiana]
MLSPSTLNPLISSFASPIHSSPLFVLHAAEPLLVRSFLGNPVATGCVACALELASWIYGAASFIVVRVTFPSICHLQTCGFRSAVQSPSATSAGCSWMVMVTASQFAAVLVTTRRRSYDSLFNAGELACYSDEELECMKIVHPLGRAIFFQKRQAFVTYLENNRAGIAILGFTVDRAWLHTIFIYAGNYFGPVAFGQDNWDLLKPPILDYILLTV